MTPPRRTCEQWPVRAFRLGEEPGDDFSASTTIDERLEMVWALRDRMWELKGRPLPSYSRESIPIRVFER